MESSKKVLILPGGWHGHQPELVSKRFANIMEKNGYTCTISEDLAVCEDLEMLKGLDLIVPCYTMSEISDVVCDNILEAVGGGVGLAGCHGGMCDSFRQSVKWQFMTGGQWVSHPGGDGVEYTVNIHKGSSPIIDGLEDFPVKSEHYYLHVDPAVEVLATTRFPSVKYFHSSNKACDMPIAWTKFWGHGRVFYNALGHHDDVFDNSPTAQIIMERGMLWAAQGKERAIKLGLSADDFKSEKKMY